MDIFDELDRMEKRHEAEKPKPLTREEFVKARKAIKAKIRQGGKFEGSIKPVKRGRRVMTKQDVIELTTTLANRSLPLEVRARRDLTNADIRVLAVLVEAAGRAKSYCFEISVPEIANRAAMSDRQVQKTTKKLLGLVVKGRPRDPDRLIRDITFRKVRPGMNLPNIYNLAPECFKTAPDEARQHTDSSSLEAQKIDAERDAPRGEQKLGVKNIPSRDIISTSTGKSRSKDLGCRKSGLQGRRYPRENFSSQERRSRRIPSVQWTESQIEIAKRALKALNPKSHPSADPLKIVEAVEEIRVYQISEYDSGRWPVDVRKHGAKAYLAVLETELQARVRAGTDRFIVSKAGYLGGICAKRPDEVFPMKTIVGILDNYSQWIYRA